MRTRIIPVAMAIGIGALASSVVPGMANADSTGVVRKDACWSRTAITERPDGVLATMTAPGTGCGTRLMLTCYRPDGSAVAKDSGTGLTGGWTENDRVGVGVVWPINYCVSYFKIRTATGANTYALEVYRPVQPV